ncbi:MAG: TolC family protein, partial [Cyanobacteria bacterium REEB65]|nr:TolC family protein [Cyanobacteria bacterium REEB65]
PSYGAQVGLGLWSPGNQPYLSGMVTVTLPWLAPARYQHLVHHAMDHAAAAVAQLQGLRDDLRARAVSQSVAFARSRQEVSLYEQGIVPQLEAAYRSSLAAYEVGKADFADVIAEERDLYQARLTALQALSGERKAFAALETLAGDFAPVAADGPSVDGSMGGMNDPWH